MNPNMILHVVRKQLGVTCNDYCLLDLIHCEQNHPKAKVLGWCSLSRQQLADSLDFSRRTIIYMIGDLLKSGLLEENGTHLRTSAIWNKAMGGTGKDTRADFAYERILGVQNLHIQESDTCRNCTDSAEFAQAEGEGVQNLHTSPEIPDFSPDPSHALTHGGNSILLNNFFETLKEEKNKEEKINPPNPLDKKQENKKEEMRVRRQNRAARVMICGLMLHKVKIRKGKRLKRLPKRKPVKIINIPFDEWWNLYDYKVDRSPKLEKKWENLTNAERQTAMEHTALYVKATPGKAYRKYPSTYLNNKSFNNEIVQNNGNDRKATGTPQKLRATNLIPIATPAGYKFGNVIKASDIDVPDID